MLLPCAHPSIDDSDLNYLNEKTSEQREREREKERELQFESFSLERVRLAGITIDFQ